MFFFISKILSFLLSPLVWFFVLFVVAWKIKSEKWKKRLKISAFVILYLSTNSFIIDELARGWEPVTPDYYLMDTKYDVAVVLGGIGRIDPRLERIDFSYSGDRLFQTIELFHKRRVKKILFTGGSGSIDFQDQKEALYVKKYLNSIHVHDSDLIIESNSRNTFENAKYSKQILDSLEFEGSVLLVTSASHMPRALACFKKQGFTNITPYLTNRISGPRKFALDHCFIPNVEAAFHLQILLHEWIGYFMYFVKGYV